MALREEFEATGEWLFRRRSYLPLVVVGAVVASLVNFAYPGGDHTRDLLWELVCLGVGLAGVAVRVVTVGYAARGTSGRNTHGQEAETLSTTGPYSVVRHPLYVGNYLMWLGPALFPRSVIVVVVVSLVFWLYYERIMFAEEEYLRRRFGEVFEDWAAVTPAFVPRLHAWRRPAISFSFREVLRREYSGLFGLVATFAVLEVVGDLAATGRIQVDLFWAATVGVALALYLTLLALKRRTSLLSARGSAHTPAHHRYRRECTGGS